MPPTHNPSEGEAVPMREMYEAFERLRIAVDRELADYIYPPTNDYEENLELLRRSVGRLEFQEMREGIDHLLALLKEDYSRLSIFTMGAIGDELKSAFRSLSALLKDQKYRITRAIQIHDELEYVLGQMAQNPHLFNGENVGRVGYELINHAEIVADVTRECHVEVLSAWTYYQSREIQTWSSRVESSIFDGHFAEYRKEVEAEAPRARELMAAPSKNDVPELVSQGDSSDGTPEPSDSDSIMYTLRDESFMELDPFIEDPDTQAAVAAIPTTNDSCNEADGIMSDHLSASHDSLIPQPSQSDHVVDDDEQELLANAIHLFQQLPVPNSTIGLNCQTLWRAVLTDIGTGDEPAFPAPPPSFATDDTDASISTVESDLEILDARPDFDDLDSIESSDNNDITVLDTPSGSEFDAESINFSEAELLDFADHTMTNNSEDTTPVPVSPARTAATTHAVDPISSIDASFSSSYPTEAYHSASTHTLPLTQENLILSQQVITSQQASADTGEAAARDTAPHERSTNTTWGITGVVITCRDILPSPHTPRVEVGSIPRVLFTRNPQSTRVFIRNLPQHSTLAQVRNGVTTPEKVVSIHKLSDGLTRRVYTVDYIIEFTDVESAKSFTIFAKGALLFEDKDGGYQVAQVDMVPTDTYYNGSKNKDLFIHGATRCLILIGFPAKCVWSFICMTAGPDRTVDVLYKADDGDSGTLYIEYDTTFIADQTLNKVARGGFPYFTPQPGNVAFIPNLPPRPESTDLYETRRVAYIPPCHLGDKYFRPPHNDYIDVPQSTSGRTRQPPAVFLPPQDTEHEDNGDHHEDGWSITQDDALALMRDEVLRDHTFPTHYPQNCKLPDPLKVLNYAAIARHRREKVANQGLPEGSIPDCTGDTCGCVPLKDQPIPDVIAAYLFPCTINNTNQTTNKKSIPSHIP